MRLNLSFFHASRDAAGVDRQSINSNLMSLGDEQAHMVHVVNLKKSQFSNSKTNLDDGFRTRRVDDRARVDDGAGERTRNLKPWRARRRRHRANRWRMKSGFAVKTVTNFGA